MKKKILSFGVIITLIIMLLVLTGCNDNSEKNEKVNNDVRASVSYNPNIIEKYKIDIPVYSKIGEKIESNDLSFYKIRYVELDGDKDTYDYFLIKNNTNKYIAYYLYFSNQDPSKEAINYIRGANLVNSEIKSDFYYIAPQDAELGYKVMVYEESKKVATGKYFDEEQNWYQERNEKVNMKYVSHKLEDNNLTITLENSSNINLVVERDLEIWLFDEKQQLVAKKTATFEDGKNYSINVEGLEFSDFYFTYHEERRFN